jgi:8-oxo-dGTP pyrophosphatase MutT (NUDIX family)
MPTREAPIERKAARVVLLDPDGRVLLFGSAMPDGRPGRLWVPAGGALEPDEDWATAARRELREETGLDVPLGPCVWIREHVWFWGARSAWYRAIEHFFVTRTPTSDIDVGGWTPEEQQAGIEWRWWTRDELLTTTDTLVPRHLGELVQPLIAGELPASPLVIVD